jgi:hypothetical protein
MKIKLIVFFLICSVFGFAQSKIQIGINGTNSQVRVVNLKTNGAMLLDKSVDGVLSIKKYDTSLVLNWEVETELGTRLNFVEEFVDDAFVYILLETRQGGNFTLLKISTAFAAIQKLSLVSLPGFEVSHFKVSQGVYCIGGQVKNDPFLVIFDPATLNVPRFISSNIKGETLLQSLDADSSGVHLTLLNKAKKKTNIIYRNFDFSGKLLQSLAIAPTLNFEFLSTKFFHTSDKKLLLGNYGLKGASNSDFSSSQGIFITDLSQNPTTQYYSFDKFSHFFDFLSEKQQERLSKQVKKKKEKGGEFKFDYRLLINEVLPFHDQLLIASEVFVPEFRTNNMYSNFYGNPMFFQSGLWGRQYYNNLYWANNPALWGYRNTNSRIFDGFKYLQGLVISIDKNGALIYDNSVQYKNLKYFDLKQHLKLSADSTTSLISYVKEDKLIVNTYDTFGKGGQNKVIEKSLNERTLNRKKSEFENIEHWFGQYFINWGLLKNSENLPQFKVSCFIQKIER